MKYNSLCDVLKYLNLFQEFDVFCVLSVLCGKTTISGYCILLTLPCPPVPVSPCLVFSTFLPSHLRTFRFFRRQMCPSASTMVILADRRAGTYAAIKASTARDRTLRPKTGQTRSTRSGTGFDDPGGTYVGCIAVMMA